MKYFLVFPLFVLLLACRTSKDPGKEYSTTYHPANPEYAETGITFVSFRFQTVNDSLVFTHASTTHAEGKLKKKDEPEIPAAKYVVQLQNITGVPLRDFTISDPLKESIDVFSEDGTIQRGEIKHKEKVVSFRFSRLSGEFTRAALYQIESPGKFRYITTIECKSI